MKTTQKFLAVMVVTVSLGASLVHAQNVNKNINATPLKMYRAHHTEAMEFVKNNNYEGFKTWAAQNDKAGMIEQVTPEKFAKMVELYNAVEKKDWETANQLKKEIGFKGPGFMGPGHKMMHKGMKKMHEQFDKLPEEAKTQLKEAFKNRDHEQIKKILEQNGITPPPMLKVKTN